MKKSTAYVLLYFATLLLVAILTSCQTRTVTRKPSPCPSFDKPHNRDMPHMHYNP